MRAGVKKPSVQPELMVATPEQMPILANLLQLYAHDFSEFHAIDLMADGRFCYPELPSYWCEPGRHPFLVRMHGQLAGFVLVNKGSRISDSDLVWDMAEFFVVRGYRRLGVGTEIAHEVWKRLPGLWEVRVMRSNQAACLFWERAIAKFTSHVSRSVWGAESGEPWEVFSFEAREPAKHDRE